MLVSLTLGASINNAKKFYIKQTKAGVEIWKGQFAPMNTQKVVFLEGLHLPGITHKIYSKQEVFPITYNYYLGLADTLIKEQALPDFQPIIDLVDKAADFATTPKEKEAIALYERNIHEALTNIKSTRIILPVLPSVEETIPVAAEQTPEGNSVADSAYAPLDTESAPAAVEAEAAHGTESASPTVDEANEKETSEPHN